MQKWLQAARIYVIGASALPVVLGTLLALYEQGRVHFLNSLLSFAGAILIHSAANLLNDYYDYRSGADLNNPEAVFPFSGGSRVILENKLSPGEVYHCAKVCLLVASIIGIYLTWRCGVWVLVLGVYGVLTSIYYVHPRFSLLNIGVGELIVGLNFGLLLISGAYYVQTGTFSLSCIMASVPVSLLIALVLIINEFPDYTGDKLADKKTIVVRLGRRRAAGLVALLLGITVISIILIAAGGFTNSWSLAALFTLPFMLNAGVCSSRHYDNIPAIIPANISIIKTHLFVNIYLSLSCLYTGELKRVSVLLIMLVFTYQLLTMRKLHTFSDLGGFIKSGMTE